jgi:hypothetical protein
MARPPTPDEIRGPTKRKSDDYRPEDWMEHAQRATVTSVDPDNGVVTIEMESTPGTRTGVTIPLHFFSWDPGNPLNAAWMRYMPQNGDMVKVVFDTNSTVRIVGYDVPSYADVNAASKSSNFGWTTLQPGEWDMKSIGDAFIKGDLTGRLYLAGGTQSVAINKRSREIDITTNTLKHLSSGSLFRDGIVKRSPIPSQAEVEAKASLGVPPPASINPATAVLQNLVEHTVDLQSATAVSPYGTPVVFASIGNVMDPDVDEIGLGAWGAAGPNGIMKFDAFPAVNARALLRIYNSVPLTDVAIGTPGPVGGTLARPFEAGIDQNGNLFINQSPGTNPFGTPGGVEWWCPQQWNLWSTHVALNAVLTQIGDPKTADEPVICGDLWLEVTTTLANAWEAFNTALATWVAAQAAFGAATSAFLITTANIVATGTPPTTGGIIVPPTYAAQILAYGAAAATSVAANAAFATAAATLNAAIATYIAVGVPSSFSAAVLVSKFPLSPVPSAMPSPFQL